MAGAWAPKEEFTYKGADGKFDKGEATRLRITDEMAPAPASRLRTRFHSPLLRLHPLSLVAPLR